MASVYVASPLGFSEVTRGYYVGSVLRSIRDAGFIALDPWDDAEAPSELDAARSLPAGPSRLEALGRLNTRVGARNAEAIRACDALLAILEGVDVDSGTAAEVGYAVALLKPIVGVRLDRRTAGENEAGVVNLQVEYFIHLSGGTVHHDLDAAVAALGGLVEAGRRDRTC